MEQSKSNYVGIQDEDRRKNLEKMVEVNKRARQRAEKIKYLDEIINELKEIQIWCLDNKLGKRGLVTKKIAYASSVREFLRCGKNHSQFARAGGRKTIAGVSECILLEETNNNELKRFIRRIDTNTFLSRQEYIKFKNAPERLSIL